MKKIIFLLLILTAVMFSGCDFVKAVDALGMTFETMNEDKETQPPDDDTPQTSVNEPNLFQTLIINDNKTIAGDHANSVEWIEIYKTEIYSDSHRDIKNVSYVSSISIESISADFDVVVNNIKVEFPNSQYDNVSVITVHNYDISDSYLADIIKNEKTDIFDIYDILKADGRFADKIYENINNICSDEINEVNVTELLSGYFTDTWTFDYSHVRYTYENVIELALINSEENSKKIIEVDLTEKSVISDREELIDAITPPEKLTQLSSDDKQHTAYIDGADLYVRDESTGDIWLLHEGNDEEEVNKTSIPEIFGMFNNKLIYTIYGYDSPEGVGIYDLKNNINTIYTDKVMPAGVQNNKLILAGNPITSTNPVSFAVDLNSKDNDAFPINHSAADEPVKMILPENETFAVILTSNQTEKNGYRSLTVEIFETTSMTITDTYNIECFSKYLNDLIYDDGRIIVTNNVGEFYHDCCFVINYK